MPIRNGIEISDEDAQLYDEYMDKSTYYDRLQYVYKIKLNSAYGALTNYHFRFFDLRMGESTTGTGRAILRHQVRKVAELLDGNYNIDPPLDANALASSGSIFPAESVIYGDTDSVYFKTHAHDQVEAIKIADTVADSVNKSFKGFMQDAFLCTPGYDDIIKCGREVVADRGIFVDKKRYVLHLVDLDGHSTDKIKMMGLELKKTTLPKAVQLKLTQFVERLLQGEHWDTIKVDIVAYKSELINSSIVALGLPKGIKGVEAYTQSYQLDNTTRLPGHVAASILYNMMLEKYKDKQSPVIMSNMKIRIFYLKNNIDRFKAIALPTDIEEIPSWFAEHFEPNIDTSAQLDRLVDRPLQHILTAICKEVPNIQSLLVDDLLTF